MNFTKHRYAKCVATNKAPQENKQWKDEVFIMKKKLFAAITAVCLLAVAFMGCGSEGTENGDLKGNITLAGSTSMEKLCEAMSESYMITMHQLNCYQIIMTGRKFRKLSIKVAVKL